MNRKMLDLYSDYLISSFSYTTATGLSAALDGAVSHDSITRFLSKKDYDSRQLWRLVKSTVRKVETDDGILIVDDTIEPKPYTDESELIAYHYDHTKGESVKGVNILSCLYHSGGMNIPVNFLPITKPKIITNPKTGKPQRKALKTKNEYCIDMLDTCVYSNRLKFKWVVADRWFSSTDNMRHIKKKLHKEFVMPIKSNRLTALSKVDKLQGKFQGVKLLKLEVGTAITVWLKGLEFPVKLVKQVFKNQDGSEGTIYLVCSELTMTGGQILEIYQKRWKVEEHYKSVKVNTGLAKSPTQTTRTQNNHFFVSLYANFKLEKLKLATGLNHFALKSKLYLQALKTSMCELEKLQTSYHLHPLYHN